MVFMRAGLGVLALVGALAAGDEASDAAVRVARTVLAERLHADVSTSVVVDVRAVDWPDSSLGCPSPGLMYAPSITSGHLVRLRWTGTVYEIHVGGGRGVMCGETAAPGQGAVPPSGAKPDAAMAAADAALGLKLAEQARTALASRLGVRREDVTIASYRQAVWPDAGLGCPRPGESFPPSPTRGYRIQLQASGQRFEFHSDRARVVECPSRP